MISRVHTWERPHEKVKFKGFSNEDMEKLSPAFKTTDKYLKDTKNLNATFKKSNPTVLARGSERVAAETRYRLGGRATVYVNPDLFGKNMYQWNPSGVITHEIGHLIGPTRGASANERKEFKKAFSYKQKKMVHEFAPQMWNKRRDNPLIGLNTRQAVDPAEDFAETWRSLTGEEFTNRTNGQYFSVITTPKRIRHMERYVLK